MDELTAKRNLLYFVRALIQYGWHDKTCPMLRADGLPDLCRCGFSDAITEAHQIKILLEQGMVRSIDRRLADRRKQ